MSSTEENPVHSVVMRAAKKHNWSDARVGMISRLMTGGRLASAIKDTLVRSGRESDYGTGDGLIRKSGTDFGLPSPIKSPHAAGLLKPPLSLPIQSRTRTSMCIPPTEVDILLDLRKVGSSHQLFGSSQSTQGFVSRSDSPLSAPLIAPLLTNVHLQTGTSQHQPVLLTTYVSLDRVLEEDLALGELVDCSDAYLMSGDVTVGSANSLPPLPETALPGSVGQLSMMPGSISYHPCPPSISKLGTPFEGPSQMTPTMTWSAHADYSAGGDISPAHKSSLGVGGGTRLSAYPTSSTDSVASGVEMGRRKSTLPLRTSEISTSLSRLHSRTSPGAHMLFSKDYPQLNEAEYRGRRTAPQVVSFKADPEGLLHRPDAAVTGLFLNGGVDGPSTAAKLPTEVQVSQVSRRSSGQMNRLSGSLAAGPSHISSWTSASRNRSAERKLRIGVKASTGGQRSFLSALLMSISSCFSSSSPVSDVSNIPPAPHQSAEASHTADVECGIHKSRPAPRDSTKALSRSSSYLACGDSHADLSKAALGSSSRVQLPRLNPGHSKSFSLRRDRSMRLFSTRSSGEKSIRQLEKSRSHSIRELLSGLRLRRLENIGIGLNHGHSESDAASSRGEKGAMPVASSLNKTMSIGSFERNEGSTALGLYRLDKAGHEGMISESGRHKIIRGSSLHEPAAQGLTAVSPVSPVLCQDSMSYSQLGSSHPDTSLQHKRTLSSGLSRNIVGRDSKPKKFSSLGTRIEGRRKQLYKGSGSGDWTVSDQSDLSTSPAAIPLQPHHAQLTTILTAQRAGTMIASPLPSQSPSEDTSKRLSLPEVLAADGAADPSNTSLHALLVNLKSRRWSSSAAAIMTSENCEERGGVDDNLKEIQ